MPGPEDVRLTAQQVHAMADGQRARPIQTDQRWYHPRCDLARIPWLLQEILLWASGWRRNRS
jgi:hypothetical protein